MQEEGKEHGEPISTGEAETSRQKRGKPVKVGETQKEDKEDEEAKAGVEPVSTSEKPVKASSRAESPAKAAIATAAAAKTESKPLSQAERMRFRRRR